jgi:hypothetical protein
MKHLFIGIILGLLATSAFATGNQNGCQGNCPTSGGSPTATATGGHAFSAAAAQASALGIGSGGAATATANPVVNNPVDVETKSLSFGGTGLAASANSCQGSISVGPFGGTYSVEFCKFLAIADGMRASGFTVRSVQKVMCKIPEVAESEECQLP